MEAKLTCMAVAAALGFEYIHVPLHHLDHKANATEIEEFLNLGAPYEHYSNWRGDDPILKKRDAPNVGRCKEPGWIRRVELGTETCKADGKTLYWHDNCWDRFYCYGFAESGFLYNLVPQFQRLYFAKPKPEPNWLEGCDAHPRRRRSADLDRFLHQSQRGPAKTARRSWKIPSAFSSPDGCQCHHAARKGAGVAGARHHLRRQVFVNCDAGLPPNGGG
ncbi:unnamed protein product [Polarella glacialis]|uniref:Uncharacterized protein n=1 Tax=Polarella glacialis TaxID=89957 RepID=A0A813E6C0_POLGL|nr:unnamed protein product [Polarella glacialis]